MPSLSRSLWRGFGSLHCPLLGHPKSCFIRSLLVQSNPLPSLRVLISGCGRICPPLQSLCQGGEIYPEWSFFFVALHRRGNPETFLKGTYCGRYPSSPSRTFSSLLVPWQIGPPQDQVHICCPGGLSRTCILPLSALAPWCGGTSCVILPTSGEFQNPTGGTHPGRAPNPPFFPTLKQRSPPPWPFLEPHGFSQCIPHSADSKGSSN